jgi:hypothetical protein
MKIDEQKKIADEILSTLSTIDKGCILAGGAPRDWYLGNPASDLDFYFENHEWNIMDIHRKLDALGLPTNCQEGDFQLYERNPHILAVFSGDVGGIVAQFICVNQSPTYAVREFALDLSQAWYTQGRVWTTNDFDIATSKKIIRITNNLYGDGDAYVQKILAKFPDYTFVGYSKKDDMAGW